MKPKILKTALLLSLASASASAELIQLEFTDTLGKPKAVVPVEGGYLNPASKINFVIAGGLDRKFRVQILDNIGNPVESKTTSVITINDRITASGKDFYGKRVELSKVLLESSYTAKIELLDLNDVVVEAEALKFGIDVTPPATTQDIVFLKHAWGNGDISKFDYLEQREFRLSGITENSSGLDKAFFVATLEGTHDERELPVKLDTIAGQASWLKPGDYRKLFHKNRSNYNVGFKILDKAGNEGRITRMSTFNGVCGSKTVSDVWNPNTSSWEPYKAGMKVHENPYKFRVAVKRDEHVTTNGGLFGYNWGVGSSDGENVYRHLSAQIPATSSYTTFFTDTGYCGTVTQSTPKVVLAAGVESSPKKTNLKYLVEGESSWITSTTVRRNKHHVIDRVQVFVEKRSYEQKVTLSSNGSCIIPPNGVSCEIDTNIVRNAGNGYVPYSVVISSTDGRFSANFGYLLTYWDFDAPEVDSISYNNEYVEFQIYDSDAVNDWRRPNWLPTVMELRAVNSSTGQVIKAPLVDSNEPNYQRWARKHSLKDLPEGNYRLEVFVKDTYGNERVVNVTDSFIRDATPPTVQFSVGDKPLGSTLRGLENLRIKLSDVNPSEITQIQLVGGPTTDDVYLAFTATATDVYRPEYPRLFPALSLDGGYEIRVSVKDSYGNAATHTAKFAYYPANLIEIGKAKTLPATFALKLRGNEPIGVVESNTLRTETGSIAAGMQQMFFTLREDSPFAVNFAGVEIQPGQTKEINLDFGEDGKISAPVIPIESKEGVANFMIDIPQLKSKFD